MAVEPPSPSPVVAPPKQGFWARLFKKRAAETPPPAPVEEPPAPEPPPLQPVPDPEPPPEPEPEGPLPAAQELDDDRAVAVLTEVLGQPRRRAPPAVQQRLKRRRGVPSRAAIRNRTKGARQ